MIRKHTFWAAVLCTLLLCCLPARAGENPVETVKIGLAFGDNCVDAANLLNRVGSGYWFGYYDENREFQALGYTGETAIAMLKDWNMYLSNGTYRATADSDRVVGCYHIRLNKIYDTFEDAVFEAEQLQDAFPAYHDGVWRVCVGSYTTQAKAEEALALSEFEGEARTASQFSVTVVVTGSTRIIFQFDEGTMHALAVVPQTNEGEKGITWYKSLSYYGGFEYSRPYGNQLTVINYVNIDDYVKGVVPYEMSSSWPLEALKAQAVAARTYAARQMVNGGHNSKGFDLCTTDCCQVYKGTNYANEATDQACDETSGIYMTYNGTFIEAFFHSSDGGATEDCENVFTEALPYIRGKIDPYEKNINTGKDNWSYTYTANEITAILNSKGYACSTIVSITTTFTKLGNIKSITFRDSDGKTITVKDAKAGSILTSQKYGKYTHSQRFTITDANGAAGEKQSAVMSTSGSITSEQSVCVLGAGNAKKQISVQGGLSVLTAAGKENIQVSSIPQSTTVYASKFLVKGSGWGHNLGMSQYGANAMAQMGMSYIDILSFYYDGVEIG